LCRPPRSRALSSAHPAPTATYTLSLHDALPILADAETLPLETVFLNPAVGHAQRQLVLVADPVASAEAVIAPQRSVVEAVFAGRSEEHTSELQSRENLVCRLLLEKKNLAGRRSP